MLSRLRKQKRLKASVAQIEKCPVCDAILGNSECISRDVKPRPGDVSVCLYCVSILVFDSELRLKEPTEEQRQEIKRRPDIIHLQNTVRALDKRGLAGPKERN